MQKNKREGKKKQNKTKMKKKLCFPTVIRAVSYCELGQNSLRLVIIIFRQTNRLVNSCNFCKFAEFTIQTMLPFTIHFSLQSKYLTSPQGKQNPNMSDYRFLSFHIDPILVTQRKQKCPWASTDPFHSYWSCSVLAAQLYSPHLWAIQRSRGRGQSIIC